MVVEGGAPHPAASTLSIVFHLGVQMALFGLVPTIVTRRPPTLAHLGWLVVMAAVGVTVIAATSSMAPHEARRRGRPSPPERVHSRFGLRLPLRPRREMRGRQHGRRTDVDNRFFDNPILNSPYERPGRHWELGPDGQPTQNVVERRRRAAFISPIPKPKKRGLGGKGDAAGQESQEALIFDEGKGLSTREQQYEQHAEIINGVRREVDAWRQLPDPHQWRVTPETARLLRHWRDHRFTGVRPFFCQVEAVETAIWLTEVAPRARRAGRRFLQYLEDASQEANPGLLRLALKLATGAGKTTVMAMLIAWQTVNAVRRPQSRRFTRGFLVVTPGLTIRDRLRVLKPNDPDSYYRTRELVPNDLLADLDRAKIVITNYHAFRRRERGALAKGSRQLLQGRGPSLDTRGVLGADAAAGRPRAHGHEERPGAERRSPPLLPREAGRDRRGGPGGRREEGGGEEPGGGPAVDLGPRSGASEARRGPGDRPLRHPLLPERLRLRGRHPVSVDDVRLLADGRHRVRHRQAAEGAGGGQRARQRDAHVPGALETHPDPDAQAGMGKGRRRPRPGLDALYGHYEKTFDLWQEAGIPVPPCFIIVCHNIAASKLVYDYVSGFHRTREDGSRVLENGRLALFRNFDRDGRPFGRPRTLLINSEQLESGEALDPSFRRMAAPEIDRFRREIVERTGDRRQAEDLGEEDLLREVMNTVGKPGRLGDSIRCVVSVSMLSEGWDANTVTHVLGVRAFGTQLLCEQVVGRALRRQSYEPDEEGRFPVEYADVLGIPFDFTAEPVVTRGPKPPRRTVHVRAVRPDRDHLEIRFPRVAGYGVELPADRLTAEFNEDSGLALTPELVGATETRNSGIIGESVDLDLAHTGRVRTSQVVYELTSHLLLNEFRDADGEPRLHLFGQLKRIVRRWLEDHLVCKGGTCVSQVTYKTIADVACRRIADGITRSRLREGSPVKVVLDPYNPSGSTARVDFHTAKTSRYETDAGRCHVNWAILDSDWEAELCRVVEKHPQVVAWVKNHGLGFEAPYRSGPQPRTYLPDFIVLLDDGHGEDDLLRLVVEVKGYRGEDAKDKKAAMETCWVPGVNRHGGYGRWAFAEFRDVYTMEEDLEAEVEAAFDAVIEGVLA